MQPSVEIHVLQGEREMAGYNKNAGQVPAGRPAARPPCVPQIEVTFDIDANGIVHVSAKDRATNKEQSMTITGQSTLNKDDISRMVKDAEAHAEEDRQRREEAEVRNNADTLVYQTEKVLREQGDKVSADERNAVESALGDLKVAVAGTDVAAIKSATETLMAASQSFSQKLYEPPPATRTPPAPRRRARPVVATRTSSTPRSWMRSDVRVHRAGGLRDHRLRRRTCRC